LREEFYERLSQFSKTLAVALSSEKFLEETDEHTLFTYKSDLHRFQHLRASVKLRYAEAVDYRDYEPRIRKLLDTHIQASEVIQLNEPVNIFDDESFLMVKENQGVYQTTKSTASRADIIAHATIKVTTEKMDEDPAFYEKFSKLIQKAIEDFRAKRISDLEYFNKAVEIRNKVVGKVHDDVPEKLNGNEDAMAYYGVLRPLLEVRDTSTTDVDEVTAEAAIAVQRILDSHRKVNFWDDEDAQKQVLNAIDDYLFDELKERKGLGLSLEQMDEIIDKVIQVAKYRSRK